MNYYILLSIVLFGIALIVGMFMFSLMHKKKKEGAYKEPDYRAFFIMGLCFILSGIFFTIAVSPPFICFSGLGLIYLMISLNNRDKWDKNKLN